MGTGTKGGYESHDGGLTWAPIVLPAGTTSLAVDPANHNHRLAGGATLQESHDDGATWAAARTQPPGAGPFEPLGISPNDQGIWFITGHGALLRTRDAAVSWRQITGLPALSQPLIVAGGAPGRFLLTTGGHVFDLGDNANQVKERPALPEATVADQLVAVGPGPTLIAHRADGRVYRDAGAGWSAAAVTGRIASSTTGRVWAMDASDRLGSEGRILVSSDQGATWTKGAPIPVEESVEAIAALDADGSTLAAYGYGGDVFRSNDGGLSWSRLSTGLQSS